jgi:transposase
VAERNELARRDWCSRVETMKARWVVVIHESSTHTDMMNAYGRAPRGQRVYGRLRRNYGHVLTLLAGWSLDGMTADIVIDGAVNAVGFEVYVRQVLLPTLSPDDIVILDNLPVLKSKAVRGCRLLFLPAYSPDLSPIENAFAKIKQFLRSVRAQTIEALISAIERITPDDAIGFFTNAGFPELDLHVNLPENRYSRPIHRLTPVWQ